MSTLPPSQSTFRLQTMPLQPFQRTEEVEALDHEDKTKGTADTYDDPWEPPRPPPHPSTAALTCTHQFNIQYMRQIADFLAEVRGTKIIFQDRTSQKMRTMFYEIHDRLVTVLKKDSVPCFQRLFVKYREHMVFGYVITPQTLNLIIAMNALDCAKFVLEGKAPKLGGQRANPNYITSYGFFPLHQAAETFSADMVELLLHYGALANLPTRGDRIIEGLLPLHVAIENTCQHKYLEDNLLADQNYMKGNVKYIYKLIYLLCLPEMKIFLDTTRSLAIHTDNVVDELWGYIKVGKLVPAAILLLAGQRHFRNLNGFDSIKDLIEDSKFSLEREECGLESGKNTKALKQLKEKKDYFSNASVLVTIIFNAGEALDAYIQTHSKASHEEVLGKVSAILQNYDVDPTGNVICIEDLDCCPYACPVPDGVLHKHGETNLTKAALRPSTLETKAKNAAIYEPRKGQNLWYERDQFLPIWRSVLTCRFTVKMFPSYAPSKESVYNQPIGTQKKVNGERPSEVRVGLLGSLESKSRKLASDPKLASTYQSRRLFGTAALAVLNMLKRA